MRAALVALRWAVRGYQVRRCTMGFAAAALIGGLLLKPAVAQSLPPPAPLPPPPVYNWGGMGWGIGIATNFDVGGTRVTNAKLVNDIVRVEDATRNVSVGFVLEAHYFLKDYLFGFNGPGSCTAEGRSYINCTELAHGPFVAIEIGGGNSAPTANGLITGYGIGWMVGMRHPFAPTPVSSWNFGLGLRVSPGAKVLGDGIVANQPLPAGETEIRYKTEPRYGLMLLSTFSF